MVFALRMDCCCHVMTCFFFLERGNWKSVVFAYIQGRVSKIKDFHRFHLYTCFCAMLSNARLIQAFDDRPDMLAEACGLCVSVEANQVLVSCCNTRGQCPSISQHQTNPLHTFTANSCSHQFAAKTLSIYKCLQSACNSSSVRFFSRRGVRVLLHDIRCYQILTLVPQGYSRCKDGRKEGQWSSQCICCLCVSCMFPGFRSDFLEVAAEAIQEPVAIVRCFDVPHSARLFV